MFALALVDVAMKNVQFSYSMRSVSTERQRHGHLPLPALSASTCLMWPLHPIFGAILDANEPVAAYKIIFACLLGMLVLGFCHEPKSSRSLHEEAKQPEPAKAAK